MQEHRHPETAVLLTTYNGARFVEAQIESLKANVTPFTVHWLDDHSTDNSREVVRVAALSAGIKLHEYHQPRRLGFPATFFQLIESVDADIYMFCDQDDIWQPGKIDATVENLVPDAKHPVLCFSDCLVFNEGRPEILCRYSDAVGINVSDALEESRSFTLIPALGHTMGFTRPLRDIYLSHAEVARKYAISHDMWMYILAVTCGAVRMLYDVPTTLYRRHGANATQVSFRRNGRVIWTWQILQELRRGVAQQAEGFLLASQSLPPGRKLQSMTSLARLVATLHRRQSPIALARLIRSRALWPGRRGSAYIATACLCSQA